MRILALPRNVEFEAGTGEAFGAVLRSDSVLYELTLGEYPVFLQLCGARRRQGAMSLPADVDLFVSSLLQRGVAVSVSQGPDAWIVPDQQLSLAPGLELRPAAFVVVDARDQPVGLVSSLGAAILDACDGRRVAAELSLPGGYAPSDVMTELSYLQTSGFLEVLPPSMTLRRNVIVKRPADSVVAAPSQGDTKYLLTGDEAEVLRQCEGARTVRDVLNRSPSDERWTLSILSRASALGLITMSTPSASVRTVARTPPGGVMRARTPPGGVVRAPSVPMPQPDAPTTVDARAYVDPPNVDNPAYDEDAGTDVVVDEQQLRPPPATVPQRLTPPRPLTPPRATPIPTSIAAPMPRVTPFPHDAVAAPLDTSSAARLDSLASLSLQKGSASEAPTARSSKLPWILLLLVLIGGGYYHFSSSREEPAPTSKAAAEPQKSDTKPAASARALLASGYVAAKEPIVLSTTVSGRVKDVLVGNNDTIKKGQILATIDDGQTRAELSLANARIRDARRALSRTRMLIKAQAATPADLDRVTGQVEIASAEARVIQKKLEDMKIRSPINGTVLEVVARAGEALTAGPGQGVIVKVADLKALCAEVDVDEGELKRVFMHQTADVTAGAQAYKGTVYEISQQADRARGTVLVRVNIEAPPESELKPGIAVQVSFVPKE